MTNSVILLRGINVGGHHQVAMAELKQLAASLGYENPRTYVNSGNLLVATDRAEAGVIAEFEPALQQRFGFPIPVMVRTAAQVAEVLATSPYPDGDPKQVTIAFCPSVIAPTAVDRLAEFAAPTERFQIVGREVYFDFAGGLGRSKLAANVGRAIGQSTTTRNLRTVTKLAEMSHDP